GQSHGGVIALVGERRYLPLESLGQGKDAAFLVILDGIEDPYNFGQSLRSLHAAGAHGVILSPRNWNSASATVARASAGASEFMPMAIAEDMSLAIQHFKSKGLNFLCTDQSEKAISLYKSNLKKPILLMIGGEKRGISSQILRQADQILQIPYARDFRQALDTTSAVAVIAFEMMRQRHHA
ncbi:MAG: RNA methyltransferase, partial [Deinococcales bacterium]